MYFLAYSKFTANTFELTDKDGSFKHTNADGTECPCYGFLITHPDMGRLLYITDTELVKLGFKEGYMSNLKCCHTCKWYEEFFGVCCNGNSKYRADFRDENASCEEWAEDD